MQPRGYEEIFFRYWILHLAVWLMVPVWVQITHGITSDDKLVLFVVLVINPILTAGLSANSNQPITEYYRIADKEEFLGYLDQVTRIMDEYSIASKSNMQVYLAPNSYRKFWLNGYVIIDIREDNARVTGNKTALKILKEYLWKVGASL